MATSKAAAQSEAPTSAETKADAKAMTDMAAYFAAQPKVSIRCREDQWVQVNGYTFIIKKDERVEVPEDIARLLEDAGRI